MALGEILTRKFLVGVNADLDVPVEELAEFVRGLDIGNDANARLLTLTPATYTVLASAIVDEPVAPSPSPWRSPIWPGGLPIASHGSMSAASALRPPRTIQGGQRLLKQMQQFCCKCNIDRLPVAAPKTIQTLPDQLRARIRHGASGQSPGDQRVV